MPSLTMTWSSASTTVVAASSCMLLLQFRTARHTVLRAGARPHPGQRMLRFYREWCYGNYPFSAIRTTFHFQSLTQLLRGFAYRAQTGPPRGRAGALFPRDGRYLRGMSRADTWTPLGWLWHLWYQPGTPGPIRQGHNRRDSSMDDGNRRKLRFWRRWPGVFLNQPQLTSDAEARPPRASAVSSLGEPPEWKRSAERGPRA